MNIHLWVADYASGMGGIQTYSRFVARGLREIFPEARLCILSKNDTSYPDEENDVGTTFVPLGWWPPRLRTAAFSLELFRRAALERPDLILVMHVNFSPVAHSLRKLFGIRFIAFGYGIDVWEIHRTSIRRALQAADRLPVISECTRGRMADELDIKPASVPLVPCSFDEMKFTSDEKPRFLLKRYRLQSHQPVILTITRLASAERYKGYDQILRALPTLLRQFPDLRYFLGGRGPDRPRIEALIEKLGVGENVILAGYVPEHELKEHYNLCDVFAMPSKGEGFGIVFLEAMACGKPVIAGNKDGSIDAVLNGQIGALVDPDSVQEIAGTLIAILERKVGSSRNGRAATAGLSKSKVEEEALKTERLRSEGLPEIMFDPEALRARVIEAYGYEKFKQRLSEILKPLQGESRRRG